MEKDVIYGMSKQDFIKKWGIKKIHIYHEILNDCEEDLKDFEKELEDQ
tara:strand:- start:425 stop:568 length:144 start_codon:yes stop_codon:yes gene_type:complete